jgi:photosystem II stability/assembly factor-like uncharacterized protein
MFFIIMRIFRHVILSLFITLISCSLAYSQWQRILHVPGKAVYSIYFFPNVGVPQIGFAALGNEIWRTNDGGKNWTRVSTSIDQCCQFDFKDSLIGWCASRIDGIHKTTDGGWTWNSLNIGFGCEGVYYHSPLRRLFYVTWAGPIGLSNTGAAYSDNEGFSWNNIVSPDYAHNTINFISSNDGIMNSLAWTGQPFLITHDGGISWSNINFDQECWQILAMRGTGTYLAACEFSGDGIYRSDDKGSNWRKITLAGKNGLTGKLTGDIHGDLCRMYVQTCWDQAPFQPSGICRSLDEGKNWEFIGGPDAIYDRRFFTEGRYIFAGDTLGGVWFLYDTIGTSLHSHITFIPGELTFDTLLTCAENVEWIQLLNYFKCSSSSIKKITWADNSSLHPFTIVSSTSFPKILIDTIVDSLGVKFRNFGSGTYKDSLRITFNIDGKEYDTTLIVKGVRNIIPSALFIPNGLDFDTLLNCRNKELNGILLNTSCDSEFITVENLLSDFTVIMPPLIDTLLPDDSLHILVGFESKNTGIHNGNIKFTVKPRNNSERSYYLPVKAIVTREFIPLEISPSRILFDSTSSCDSSIKRVFIDLKNLNECDSIFIDTIWLDQTSDLFSAELDSNSLIPGSSERVFLTFKAKNVGMNETKLHLRYRFFGEVKDTSIDVSAFVYSGKGNLSLSISEINFGDISLCELKDTIITLTNTGCEVLTISNVIGLGSGFSCDSPLPISLKPGQIYNLKISVVVDTVGGRMSSSANAIFITNSNAIQSNLTLTKTFFIPNYDLTCYLDNTYEYSENHDVNFIIKVNSINGFTSASVKVLEFDLTGYDHNILSPNVSLFPSNLSTIGDHFTLRGTPIQPDMSGIIARLPFKTFISKDSMTNVAMTNFRIDSISLPCGTISSSFFGSSDFRYNYDCGDHAIQNLMNGVSFIEIISLRPNPSHNEITMDLQTQQKEEITIEIQNALGRMVYSENQNLTQGLNSIRFDMKEYSDGVYIIRLRSEKGVVSQSFMKMK